MLLITCSRAEGARPRLPLHRRCQQRSIQRVVRRVGLQVQAELRAQRIGHNLRRVQDKATGTDVYLLGALSDASVDQAVDLIQQLRPSKVLLQVNPMDKTSWAQHHRQIVEAAAEADATVLFCAPEPPSADLLQQLQEQVGVSLDDQAGASTASLLASLPREALQEVEQLLRQSTAAASVDRADLSARLRPYRWLAALALRNRRYLQEQLLAMIFMQQQKFQMLQVMGEEGTFRDLGSDDDSDDSDDISNHPLFGPGKPPGADDDDNGSNISSSGTNINIQLGSGPGSLNISFTSDADAQDDDAGDVNTSSTSSSSPGSWPGKGPHQRGPSVPSTGPWSSRGSSSSSSSSSGGGRHRGSIRSHRRRRPHDGSGRPSGGLSDAGGSLAQEAEYLQNIQRLEEQWSGGGLARDWGEAEQRKTTTGWAKVNGDAADAGQELRRPHRPGSSQGDSSSSSTTDSAGDSNAAAPGQPAQASAGAAAAAAGEQSDASSSSRSADGSAKPKKRVLKLRGGRRPGTGRASSTKPSASASTAESASSEPTAGSSSSSSSSNGDPSQSAAPRRRSDTERGVQSAGDDIVSSSKSSSSSSNSQRPSARRQARMQQEQQAQQQQQQQQSRQQAQQQEGPQPGRRRRQAQVQQVQQGTMAADLLGVDAPLGGAESGNLHTSDFESLEEMATFMAGMDKYLEGGRVSGQEELAMQAVVARVLSRAQDFPLLSEVGPPDGLRLQPPAANVRVARQAGLARKRQAVRLQLGYSRAAGYGSGAQEAEDFGVFEAVAGAAKGLGQLAAVVLGNGKQQQQEAGGSTAATAAAAAGDAALQPGVAAATTLGSGAPAAYQMWVAERNERLIRQLSQLSGTTVAVVPLLQLDSIVEQWESSASSTQQQ